ncbi:MAG: hypothetical protein ACMV1B_11845 [Prevotella sp.]
MKHELKDIMFIYCTLILAFWFMSSTYQFNKETKRLNTELLLAKTIAVELYNERDVHLDMINSMNAYADSLELELQKYKHLEKFKKELDRSTSK